MITIQFDRTEKHATYGPFRMHGEDAFFDICRLLTDRGWWDDPATFVDERGMACLTTRSLHACARKYRPNEQDKIENERRRKERRKTPWPPPSQPTS